VDNCANQNIARCPGDAFIDGRCTLDLQLNYVKQEKEDECDQESVIQAFLSGLRPQAPKRSILKGEAHRVEDSHWCRSLRDPQGSEALPKENQIRILYHKPAQPMHHIALQPIHDVPSVRDVASRAPTADDDDLFEIRWGEEDDEHQAFSRLAVDILQVHQELELNHAFAAYDQWFSVGCAGKLLFQGGEDLNALIDKRIESCITKVLPAHMGTGQRPARVHIRGLLRGTIIAARLRPFVRAEGIWGAPFQPILLARAPADGAHSSTKDALANLRLRLEQSCARGASVIAGRSCLQLDISAVEGD